MVECESDGSKGGESKVESHRAVPLARALSGKLRLIGSLGVVGVTICMQQCWVRDGEVFAVGSAALTAEVLVDVSPFS